MPGSGLEMLQVAAIVVAILYFAREMLIPIVLAVLLSFVLAPLVRALGRLHVPRVAAVLLVVLLGFGAILGLGAAMGRQATSLAREPAGLQGDHFGEAARLARRRGRVRAGDRRAA